MTGAHCPMCGKTNPENLDVCQFCGARLTPLIIPKPGDPAPGAAGAKPPGENLAGQEQEPPSWLRSAGEDLAPGEDKSMAGGDTPSSGPFSETPDWLAGLGREASVNDEEIPDWLTSLRDDQSLSSAPGVVPDSESSPFPTSPLSDAPGDEDWLARLGSESQASSPEPSVPEIPSGGDQPGRPGSNDDGKMLSSSDEQRFDKPDWLTDDPTPKSPQDDTPDILQEKAAVHPAEQPKWPDNLKDKTMPSGLSISKKEIPPIAPEPAAAGSASLENEPGTPWTSPGESLPEWLSNLEAGDETKPAPTTPVLDSEFSSSSAAGEEAPGWLSQLKADGGIGEHQEPKSEIPGPLPAQAAGELKKPDALPDWLSGIKRTSAARDTDPGQTNIEQDHSGDENKEAAFSLETPDWLSKLAPEAVPDKKPALDAQTAASDELNTSELPTWVQAMRPVESVVTGTKAQPTIDNPVTEQSGPLAGLAGVLPIGPGLGALRKPPAYTNKLQVTDGQQRYAAILEQLVSSESQAQSSRPVVLSSNRLWRWLISALLILVVSLPLAGKTQITAASRLQPPEMMKAYTTIGSLPSNAPVLVVFDYESALSGELEAAASPLMDHLLLQGPRLALISTTPTGPALAERLLHDTGASPLVSGHGYQAGQQYVNLGFLPGGPAGVLYFALSPASAAPYTVDGQPAWQYPPLQGIQQLDDFAAILVLTDKAESGSTWIEQTEAKIGSTPILMVISAQVEPMILPYYDSGQVKGLVTGLAGGEAYAQTFIRPDGKTGLTQSYWNPFSTGILAAEILIAVGAIWGYAATLRSRRSKTSEVN